MNEGNKKTLAVIVGALIIGLVLGFALRPASAQANAFTDFFTKLFTKPGNQQAAPTTSSSVPLYQPAIDYEQAVVNAVKSASPAVVSITISENVPILEQCPSDVPPEFQQFFGNDFPGSNQCPSGKTSLQTVGGGSGFIVSSDGLILTNKHVVSDTSASYSVLTNDGKTYTAKVLARDPNQDLAVLKINATGLPTVTLGDSDGIALGQTAIAIGNALGEFDNTVSVGVISGLARTVTASGPTGADETIAGVVQTDAAINPGNSGGPLLDLRGEVIAINTAIASDAQNVGFAIPIDRAKHDITSVESTGEIQTPFLGVRYIAIDADLAKSQNLSVTNGALVRGDSTGPAVQSGSPAAQAGIQAEDVITALDGQAIDTSHALGDLIAQHNIGDTVTLTVLRNGKTLTLKATLSKRPAGQ